MLQPQKYAGFTSGLFWHFTGGPIVNIGEIKEREKVQGKKRKTTSEATKILLKILKSKTLKATPEEHLFPNKDKNFKTLPFCCVTDIPLKIQYLTPQREKGFVRTPLNRCKLWSGRDLSASG